MEHIWPFKNALQEPWKIASLWTQTGPWSDIASYAMRKGMTWWYHIPVEIFGCSGGSERMNEWTKKGMNKWTNKWLNTSMNKGRFPPPQKSELYYPKTNVTCNSTHGGMEDFCLEFLKSNMYSNRAVFFLRNEILVSFWLLKI